MKTPSYHEQIKDLNEQYIENICNELPRFVRKFFIGISSNKASTTRLGYARDLKLFFEYIVDNSENILYIDGKTYECDSIDKITLEMLSNIDSQSIEAYIYEFEHLKHNDKAAIKRKLSALSVFYNYCYKHDMLTQNPISKVERPKLDEKQIIRMDPAETANFLDTVEYGTYLTSNQLRYHEKNKSRDLALISLMLSTGIRVSECVGLDMNDIDIENTSIRIIRKGNKEAIVYFSDEIIPTLAEYMEERRKIEPASGHENALFLSSQKKRLGVRSVENLVKKYAACSVPLKHITPHKLRSTYGTALYKETEDIYLVASVLGHSDVNTTKKHYADMDNEMKRSARNKVVLRENN